MGTKICYCLGNQNLQSKRLESNFSRMQSGELLNVINKQKSNSLCKIESKSNNRGTTFLCKIPFPTYETFLPVIITEYNLLYNYELNQGNDIKVIMNNNKSKLLSLDYKRKIYTSDIYKIIIIEIKDTDNLDLDSFLDLNINIDKNIDLKKECYSIYLNNSEEYYCKGEIIKLYNFNFDYSCKYTDGLIGSPILLMDNNEVIGMNTGLITNSKYCEGILLTEPIIDFYNKYNKTKISLGSSNGIKNINVIFNNDNEKFNIEAEENIMFGELPFIIL